MSSLDDIQQLNQLANEINSILEQIAMLNSGETASAGTTRAVVSRGPTAGTAGIGGSRGIYGGGMGVRASVGRVTSELREAEYILYRFVGMLGRLGLPENIDQALSQISRLTLSFRMLESSLMYLASGTPYGLALGTLTLFGAGMSVTASGVFGLNEIFGGMFARMIGQEQMMRRP